MIGKDMKFLQLFSRSLNIGFIEKQSFLFEGRSFKGSVWSIFMQVEKNRAVQEDQSLYLERLEWKKNESFSLDKNILPNQLIFFYNARSRTHDLYQSSRSLLWSLQKSQAQEMGAEDFVLGRRLFSLSHTGLWVLVSSVWGPWQGFGCDLEPLERPISEKLERRFLSQEERGLFKNPIWGWVLKEACWKAWSQAVCEKRRVSEQKNLESKHLASGQLARKKKVFVSDFFIWKASSDPFSYRATCIKDPSLQFWCFRLQRQDFALGFAFCKIA